ncbi:MAG TPA: class I SAM-dependent methyltransferase [Myxococcales bacterium]|nr:class I SAM-dependent methyltransferase [Myxococcales bacterium]
MSSRGALYRFLRRRVADLTCSEYFDQVSPGQYVDGIQCQDVEQLSYPDDSFNLCTSTEVFEHVADDSKGFAEVARVLRRGGLFVFTVPMTGSEQTVERAERTADGVRHLLEPEYHGDRLRLTAPGCNR